MLEELMVKLRNTLNYSNFISTRLENRCLILPQCLRNVDCQARLDPEVGYLCDECGKCQIPRIKAFCQKYEIKMYIVPGNTQVRKILKTDAFKAVLGVACNPELNIGMKQAKKGNIPSLGVPLTVTGCVNTDVDWQKVLSILLTTRK